MTKNKIIVTSIFLLSIITFSCKKKPAEVLKENLLNGEWNIDKCTLKNMSSTFTVDNYGTYTFTKDGKGSYVYSTSPGKVNDFIWTNTDSTITTTLTSNNQTTIYKVAQIAQTKQQWTTTVNNVYYDFALTKK